MSLRLIDVQRVLALLLVPALIATSGVGSKLHTHVYTDHDHPEHHHPWPRTSTTGRLCMPRRMMVGSLV